MPKYRVVGKWNDVYHTMDEFEEESDELAKPHLDAFGEGQWNILRLLRVDQEEKIVQVDKRLAASQDFGPTVGEWFHSLPRWRKFLFAAASLCFGDIRAIEWCGYRKYQQKHLR